MHDFIFVDNMEKIQNHNTRAHFINIINGSLIFTLWERGRN